MTTSSKESNQSESHKIDHADNNSNDDDNASVDSADEALSEMLGIGLGAFKETKEEEDESESEIRASSDPSNMNMHSLMPQLPDNEIIATVRQMNLAQVYENEAICLLPKQFSVPQKLMRRLSDELVYGSARYPADQSYETIRYIPNGETTSIHERRELTRFENFVNGHGGWHDLCHGYLAKCISAIVGEEMVLFKEKLNLKPPGGSGFAPHLDSPSLRVALGEEGPSTFVTVMVAIDDMTEKNGCLKVQKGPWTEALHVEVIEPQDAGNPDAGGRAGAIPMELADEHVFEPIICKGGDIVAFNGWTPHRSSANVSPFPRRAVFLTYNPAREGDFHDCYYDKMKQLRDGWKEKMAMLSISDHESEMAALNSIPR